MGYWPEHNGVKQPKQFFSFPAPTCTACPLRAQCVKTEAKRGRSIQLHPQEALLQQARALQNSPAFLAYRQVRQTVEHRQDRLVQLGIRQARYFGRKKTLFQLLMAATVANLTLIATKTGQIRAKTGLFSLLFALRKALQDAIAVSENFTLRSMVISYPKTPVFGQTSSLCCEKWFVSGRLASQPSRSQSAFDRRHGWSRISMGRKRALPPPPG
ncbi:MAG TPA: hypothetical protein DCP32_03655 [Anaerolineaceae bacterium]|nr:hypothetical protein [Anaerolineaceae bacterium]HBA90450.1 hypothetical protein [Anaerolineaceae bacterium]